MKNKIRRLLKVIYYIFSIIAIIGAYIWFSENYTMYRWDNYRVTNYASTIGATLAFWLWRGLFSDLIRRIVDYIDNWWFKGFINYKKLNKLHYSWLALLILIIITCFMIGAKEEETCTWLRQSREYWTCVCEQGYKLNDWICELEYYSYNKDGLYFEYPSYMTLGDDYHYNISVNKIDRQSMAMECGYYIWRDETPENIKQEAYKKVDNAIQWNELYNCQSVLLTWYTEKFSSKWYIKQVVVSFRGDDWWAATIAYNSYIYDKKWPIYRITIDNNFWEALKYLGNEYWYIHLSDDYEREEELWKQLHTYISEWKYENMDYTLYPLIQNDSIVKEIVKTIKYNP